MTCSDFVEEPIWVDPFICTYKMADTSKLATVISRAKESSRWYTSTVAGGLLPEMRDSRQLTYREESPPTEHEHILDFAQKCLDYYLAEHPAAVEGPVFGINEGYHILWYKPGQAYHSCHADAAFTGPVSNRHLTFVLYLSTVAEGGEIEYPKQGFKAQPVEGLAAIHPAGWTHAHRTLPGTEDRFVFNIFWGFEDTEPPNILSQLG